MNLKMRIFALLHKAWIGSGGSAAIEFAFIAPVFFALMLGIMELGVMTFTQFALQNSVTDAGRLMRTGQVNQTSQLIKDTIAVPTCASNNNSAQKIFNSEGAYFKQQICCGVDPLISDATCKSDVVVTVAAPASGFSGNFNALGTAGTYFGNSMDDATVNTTPVAANAACKIVLVRANYNWPVWFPGLAKILNNNNPDGYLVNGPNNTHLLTATAAFRSEPFSNGVAGC